MYLKSWCIATPTPTTRIEMVIHVKAFCVSVDVTVHLLPEKSRITSTTFCPLGGNLTTGVFSNNDFINFCDI